MLRFVYRSTSIVSNICVENIVIRGSNPYFKARNPESGLHVIHRASVIPNSRQKSVKDLEDRGRNKLRASHD